MWGTKKKLLRVHESWHVRPLISATRTLQFTQSPADTKMWTSQPQNKMVNKGKLITYPHRQYWGKNLITLYTWWCLLDTSRRCHHANAQLGQAWTTVATEVWAAYPPNFRPLPEPDLIHKISEQRNSPILFKIIKHKYLDAVESLSDGVTSIYYSSGKLVYQQPLLVPTQHNIAPIPCYGVGHFQAEIWKISETRRIHSSRRRPLKNLHLLFHAILAGKRYSI